MRVIGKPELSNAIRLNELSAIMSNFMPPQEPAQPPPQEEDRPGTKQSRDEKAEKKRKKRKQIHETLDQQPKALQEL